MKPLTIILYLVLTFIGSNDYAQTYSVEDFKEVPLPVLMSKEFYALSNTRYEFAVSLLNGKLQISRSVDSMTKEYIVPEGKLIAINVGEFGGGLYLKPYDTTLKQMYVNGRSRSKEPAFSPLRGAISMNTHAFDEILRGTFLLKEGNVQMLFKYKDSLYTMEGVAHMGISFGSVHNVYLKRDSVIGKQVLALDDAPMAFTIYRDNLYIATFERFYIIHNWQKELIFDKLIWGYLYPTSMAMKDLKHIYIGMRGGYAIIDAVNRKIAYFKYKGIK